MQHSQELEDLAGGAVMQMCLRINGSPTDKDVARTFFPAMLESGLTRQLCESVAVEMSHPAYGGGVCGEELQRLIQEHSW